MEYFAAVNRSTADLMHNELTQLYLQSSQNNVEKSISYQNDLLLALALSKSQLQNKPSRRSKKYLLRSLILPFDEALYFLKNAFDNALSFEGIPPHRHVNCQQYPNTLLFKKASEDCSIDLK